MTVVDILSRLFKQKVHIQKGGEEILVFCPNCKHHKRKLNINTKTGFYQCWVCNFSGKSFHSLLKKVKAPKEYYDVLCKDVPKRNNVEVKEEKKNCVNLKIFILHEMFNQLLELRMGLIN